MPIAEPMAAPLPADRPKTGLLQNSNRQGLRRPGGDRLQSQASEAVIQQLPDCLARVTVGGVSLVAQHVPQGGRLEYGRNVAEADDADWRSLPSGAKRRKQWMSRWIITRSMIGVRICTSLPKSSQR
ncbi:hypothetical protein [Methylocaldum sp.]|uniref:hypothetical protein n=1 Tax=Methylocaldum sp. TaxID=1969727 RepID=UPI002D5B3807|nr:hypothetical protein [Methylocaldum sp.]HYE35747.1 hypothetical protein [Methylocaldum sp.]